MSDITSRVWDVYRKKMIYDIEQTEDDEPYSVFNKRAFISSHAFYYLMKNTGVPDKHGKYIYEGDIIDIHQTVNGCNLFLIEWAGSEIIVRYLVDGETSRIYEYDIEELLDMNVGCNEKTIEVVGNIYENRELLGGKE